jgi:DNA-binding NarL/FixJ family response regulator
MVHDDQHLQAELTASPNAILLINRLLEPGFQTDSGIDLISSLKQSHPQARLLLVSNYEDAQADAQKAGALPGFGKRDIGSPKLSQAIQNAAR